MCNCFPGLEIYFEAVTSLSVLDLLPVSCFEPDSKPNILFFPKHEWHVLSGQPAGPDIAWHCHLIKGVRGPGDLAEPSLPSLPGSQGHVSSLRILLEWKLNATSVRMVCYWSVGTNVGRAQLPTS